MITETTVPRIMRNVVFAITYILFQVLYNQLTNFSLIVNSTRDIKRCLYSSIFSYIPNVRLISMEILAYIAQFPKRIDVLIIDIYMKVTKELSHVDQISVQLPDSERWD